MTLKRKKVKRRQAAEYPTVDQARQHRRRFLRILGKGLLAAPLMGLARCGAGREQLGDAGNAPDVIGDPDWMVAGNVDIPEPDWHMMGIAPWDIEDPRPDPDAVEPDWPVAGDMDPPDIKEDFPPMPGEAVDPDILPQKPDTGSYPQDVEEDWPIPGGIGEQPDVGAEPDMEEWPLEGDMPMPDVKPHVDAGGQPSGDIVGEVDGGFPPLDGDMEDPDF